MKNDVTLTVTSLLTALLTLLHVTDDIIRGISPPGLDNLTMVVILTVWLYATLVLTGRRSGYVILMAGCLLALVVLVLHFKGAGIVRAAKSGGGFFFIWTLLALGTTALFSFILCVHGLWSLRRR